MFEVLYPSLPRGVVRVLGEVMGRLALGQTHASFANDVMVEAEAELACDARDVVPDIAVPALLVCGDRDGGFSRGVYEETGALIRHCTLRMYEGRGHMGVADDKRFAPDILDFVRLPALGPNAQVLAGASPGTGTPRADQFTEVALGPSSATAATSRLGPRLPPVAGG